MPREIEDALTLVLRHTDLANFVGRRDEALVKAAEAAIGATFPASYRTFLLELGMGDFEGEEFAGILDGRFQALWPDSVGLYLRDLRAGLPRRYFPFYSWGDGTVTALDFERRDSDGENPVVTCHDGLFASAPIEEEAPNFGVFFLSRLREGLVNR